MNLESETQRPRPLYCISNMATSSAKRVGAYEIGRSLGRGTFGKVKYAINLETGQHVAIKIMDKAKIIDQNLGEQIKKEISIMRMIKHQHTVNLVEVLTSKTKIFIVLELVTGGELFDRIVAEGRLDEITARRYFRQLVSGVAYCHSKGICHRDLKPENMLLDEFDQIKISDFGLSALVFEGPPLTAPVLSDEEPETNEMAKATATELLRMNSLLSTASVTSIVADEISVIRMQSIQMETPQKAPRPLKVYDSPPLSPAFAAVSDVADVVPPAPLPAPLANVLWTTCGTPNYVAPEVLLNRGYNGQAADCWSLGVCLYCLLAGFLPFDDVHMPTLFAKIVRSEFVFPNWFSQEAMALIDGLLQVDPIRRLTCAQIQQQPWFTSGNDPEESDVPPAMEAISSFSPSNSDALSTAQNPQTRQTRPSFSTRPLSAQVMQHAPQSMNAFDLINSASGAAITHMFQIEEKPFKTHAQFTTSIPIDTILHRARVVLKWLGVSSCKVFDRSCRASFQYNAPNKGLITASLQVFIMAPGLHCIEARRDQGDLFAYHALFKQFQTTFSDVGFDHLNPPPKPAATNPANNAYS